MVTFMIEEIKSCPFCGFEFDLEDTLDEIYQLRNMNIWMLTCNESKGGCTASVLGDSMIDVVNNWNKRCKFVGSE